jgi:putative spermidine/putrescine transport system substrate-binding protein
MKKTAIFHGRIILSVLIGVFLGGLLITPGLSFAKDEIVVCTYGGAAQEAQRKTFYAPFEKETGIKVLEASPPVAAKIKAMVQSGNVEWDVVYVDLGAMITLVKENALEKIDYDLMDKKTFNNLHKTVIYPHGVGLHYWALVIAYNNKVFSKNPPRSWKDVWDAKNFPGPRSLKGSGGGVVPNLESAMMADGVPPDKVYPIDLDRAFKSYDKVKSNVVKWWTTGAMPPQMLTDNEAVIVDTYNGRIEPIQKSGAPVTIEWNQGLLLNDYWVIPKGTKNFKNAMKFIEFSLRADRQAGYANEITYGPVNSEAYKLIKPERAKLLPSYPENMKKMVVWNGDWWGENRDKVLERWNAWMLTK